MVDTKQGIGDEAFELGVRWVPHSESTKMAIASWYHREFNHDPFFRHKTAVTIYPCIYYPDMIQDAFWDHWRWWAHELVHFRRQRSVGVVKWVSMYLYSWKFRWYEERYAFLRDIMNKRLTLDQAVDGLSGDLYGLKMSATEIREWLQSGVEAV